ncbi:MAG TPA: small ribosomal subunit biogenesis GTPase RsgA [Gammaproteobacteria bacterium]
MSKRKLNRRQQWRAEKIQQERLQRAQRKQVRAVSDDDNAALGEEQEGLVIASYGASLEVEAHDGTTVRCQLRQNLPLLVVGDRVIWQAAGEGGVVTARLERRTQLARPDAHGELKALAANIDQILVVAAPAPLYSADLINQYLAAAELTGIAPLLVFNKIDLIDAENREQVEALLAIYRHIGYPVISASTKREHGLDLIIEHLKGHTSVFVGQSGVGKSSLVQALLPQASISVGELSSQSGLGQHTTSTARLYHLPAGGQVIDSPGVREFRLWPMSRQQLAHGFIEFAPYLGQCKFRDCSHQHEPGCALQQALKQGHISALRLQSYQKIAGQLEEYETGY